MRKLVSSRGKLFVIAGSSGAGKTTAVQNIIPQLAQKYGITAQRVVTYTTKPPRAGEIPGQDYHYISPAEFQEKIAAGFFLEWSQAYGHYYGSPAHLLELLAAGISLFLIIDLAGVRALRQLALADTIYIWITVPPAQLAQRLMQRQTESAVELARRLALAQQEAALVAANATHVFDYLLANDRSAAELTADLERLLGEQLGYSVLPESNLAN